MFIGREGGGYFTAVELQNNIIIEPPFLAIYHIIDDKMLFFMKLIANRLAVSKKCINLVVRKDN